MALILVEDFTADEFDDGGWVETVETGCTGDGNATPPGTPPPQAGIRCYQATALTSGAAENDAYAVNDHGSQVDPSYARAYIYWSDNSLDNAGYFSAFSLGEAGVGTACVIYLYNSSGTPLALWYSYYSGALNYKGSSAFELNTWHRIEFKYDVGGNSYDFRQNGSPVFSGTLPAATLSVDSIVIGIGSITDSPGGGATTYTDLVKWGSDGWFGPSKLVDRYYRTLRV
jgi:hypothetical protein